MTHLQKTYHYQYAGVLNTLRYTETKKQVPQQFFFLIQWIYLTENFDIKNQNYETKGILYKMIHKN